MKIITQSCYKHTCSIVSFLPKDTPQVMIFASQLPSPRNRLFSLPGIVSSPSSQQLCNFHRLRVVPTTMVHWHWESFPLMYLQSTHQVSIHCPWTAKPILTSCLVLTLCNFLLTTCWINKAKWTGCITSPYETAIESGGTSHSMVLKYRLYFLK